MLFMQASAAMAQSCSEMSLVVSATKVCVDNSIELVTNGVPTGSDYTWSFGNQVKNDDIDTVKFIALKEGNIIPSVLIKTPTNLTCKLVLGNNARVAVMGNPKKLSLDVNPGKTLCRTGDLVTIEAKGGASDLKYTYLIETHGSLSLDYLYRSESAKPSVTTRFYHEGFKKVTLELENADGCVTSVAFDSLIGVGNLPDPSFKVSDPETCDRKVVDITNYSMDNNVSYSWSLPGATPSTSILPEPKGIAYTSTGSFDIGLQVSNEFGCKKSFEIKDAVVVGTSHNLDIAINKAEVCNGEPLEVRQKIGGLNPENLDWVLSGATVDPKGSTLSKKNIQYARAGRYDVGVTYTEGGCASSFTYIDTILVHEVFSNFRQNVICACNPDSVYFENTSIGNSLKYYWEVFNVNQKLIATSTDRHLGHTFKSQGAFKVQLTATDSVTGCSSTSDRSVVFRDIEAAFVLGSDKLCVGENLEAQLDITKTCPEAVETYEWTVYDGNGTALITKSIADFKYTIKNTGTYSLGLKIKSPDGCEDEIVVQKVAEVFELETKVSTAQEFLCANDTIELKASNGPYPVATSNKWLIIDPVTKSRFTGDGTSIQFPITTPGAYDVYLYAFKNTYCADTVLLKNQYKVSGASAKIVKGKRASCVPFDDRVIAEVKHNFHYQNTSDALQFEWFSNQPTGISFSDRLNDTSKVSITQANTYALGVTITNSDGCVTTFDERLSYEAGVVAFFGHNSTACTDVPLSITNKSFVNPTSFKWSVINHSAIEIKPKKTAKSPRIVFPEPGVYTIELIAENDLGCVDTMTKNVNVIEFDYDFASADSQNILCAPALVKFDVQSTNVDSFYWIFGDGEGLGVAEDGVAHLYDILNFDPANIYQFDVSLVAMSKFGCFDTLSKADYVRLSGPRPSFVLDPKEGTQSQEVTFYEQNDAVSSYSFDYGDQTTAVDDSIPKHTYTIKDTSVLYVEYTPIMVARDNRGCSRRYDAGPVRIYNGAIPRFSVDTFEACESISIAFNNTSSFADSFQWLLNEDTVPFSYDRNPYLSLPVGEHSVTLKAFNLLGEGVALQRENIIVVYKNPVVRMGTEYDFYCRNTEVHFEDKSYGDKEIVSRLWDFQPSKPGVDTSSFKNPSWIYANNGDKSVQLMVTDAFGCTSSKLFTDTVKVGNPRVINHRGLSYVSHRSEGVFATQIAHLKVDGISGFLLSEINANDTHLIQPIAYPAGTLLDTGYYEFRPKTSLAHYQLMGIDDCRDTVSIGPMHKPVHLQVAENEVGFLPGIHWSAYEGWQRVDSYYVYRSTDASKPVKIATLPGDSTHYLDREVCAYNYEYYIKVFANGESTRVRSNKEEIRPDYSPPFGSTQLFTTTVTDRGLIRTNWSPHPHPQVNRYVISRTDPNFGFIERHAVVTDTFYVDSIDIFIDRDVYEYHITGIDFCDSKADQGLKGNSIVLNSTRNEEHIDLNWNRFEDWPQNETNYLLEKADEDGTFETIFKGNATSFQDENILLFEDEIIKYRITATYGNRTSVSNTLLELPNLKVFIPNAFSPNNDGINDEYRVTGSGGLNGQELLFDNFRLVVLNRWGEIVFESNDIYEGWNGQFKGVPSPVGTYVYHIEFRDKRGRFQYHKGNLSLIN